MTAREAYELKVRRMMREWDVMSAMLREWDRVEGHRELVDRPWLSAPPERE